MTFVQAALEPIAEHRAERLALPDGVEQLERCANARGREIDSVAIGCLTRMCEVRVPQDCRRGGVAHRRRVDESASLWRLNAGPTGIRA